MLFQMQRDTGVWESVEYSSFAVGPESDKYRISVSGFSGDTGDALTATFSAGTRVNSMKFTTPDQDNDLNPWHCHGGEEGWWFNNCARSSLNADGVACWNAYVNPYVYDVISSRMLVKLD